MAWTEDTSDQLLVDIRNTGFLPDASDQTDTVLLRMADSELRTMVAAAVEANRGEHWLRYEDTAIVPGTTRYRLPRRVLGRAVRAVTVLDPNGAPMPPLAELDPITLRSMFKSTDTGDPRWFAFEDDFLNLGAVPASSGWTLRVQYVMRPGALALVGSYTAIARLASAGSTTSLTVYDTATLASFVKYALYDIIRGSEPYGPAYIDRYADANYTSPGPTITLHTSTPVVVADFTIEGFSTYGGFSGRECMWWTPRDTTPFPMIPKVMWDSLVHGVVAQALAAVRDPGARDMRVTALAKLHDGIRLMGPRDQRNSKRIVSVSALRTNGRTRPGWRPT